MKSALAICRTLIEPFDDAMAPRHRRSGSPHCRSLWRTAKAFGGDVRAQVSRLNERCRYPHVPERMRATAGSRGSNAAVGASHPLLCAPAKVSFLDRRLPLSWGTTALFARPLDRQSEASEQRE